MTKLEKLKEYLKSGTGIDENFMVLERGGVKYVYMPIYDIIDPYKNYHSEARSIGFVINDVFYATDYTFAEVDKVFDKELKTFREKYIEIYNRLLSAFSVDNPVPITPAAGDYDPEKEENDLEIYFQNRLPEEAAKLFFFNETPVYFSIYNDEFAEPFVKYLLYDEEYLVHFIKERLLKNAVMVNFRLKKDKALYEMVDKMKSDSQMIKKKVLYEKLIETDGAKYRVKFGCDGHTVDKVMVPSYELKSLITKSGEALSLYRLSREDQNLMRSFCEIHDINSNYFNFDTIEEITYGRKVLYSKEKGVV